MSKNKTDHNSFFLGSKNIPSYDMPTSLVVGVDFDGCTDTELARARLCDDIVNYVLDNPYLKSVIVIIASLRQTFMLDYLNADNNARHFNGERYSCSLLNGEFMSTLKQRIHEVFELNHLPEPVPEVLFCKLMMSDISNHLKMGETFTKISEFHHTTAFLEYLVEGITGKMICDFQRTFDFLDSFPDRICVGDILKLREMCEVLSMIPDTTPLLDIKRMLNEDTQNPQVSFSNFLKFRAYVANTRSNLLGYLSKKFTVADLKDFCKNTAILEYLAEDVQIPALLRMHKQCMRWKDAGASLSDIKKAFTDYAKSLVTTTNSLGSTVRLAEFNTSDLSPTQSESNSDFTDTTKISTLFTQMAFLAEYLGPLHHFIYRFVDDRQDLITEAMRFFRQHPCVIPRTCRFQSMYMSSNYNILPPCSLTEPSEFICGENESMDNYRDTFRLLASRVMLQGTCLDDDQISALIQHTIKKACLKPKPSPKSVLALVETVAKQDVEEQKMHRPIPRRAGYGVCVFPDILFQPEPPPQKSEKGYTMLTKPSSLVHHL